MLFMVIEQFRDGNSKRIGERFARLGRMLPKRVLYHASWMEPSGARCFQLMEAQDRRSLRPWIRRWEDLVKFEIVPVMTSQEYWRLAAAPHSRNARQGGSHMKFEDAGRSLDKEIANLVKFLDEKVKPSTKKEMSSLLLKASERLAKLAKSLEEKA